MEKLALLPSAERLLVISELSATEIASLEYDWEAWARPKQLPPPGAWLTWILRTGRGFGKSKSGSGWIHMRAMESPGRWCALVGKTPADARDVMLEGPAGILKHAAPHERPLFEPSKRRVTWPNGSWATLFSSEEPDQIRGFSGDTAWLDEFCFVAGTMIQTEHGPAAIETVRRGALVETRNGLRPVVQQRCSLPAAEVYRLTLDDGRTLVGTGNHPIWVQGQGFVPLQSVQNNSILVVWDKPLNAACCGAGAGGGSVADTTRAEKGDSYTVQSIARRSVPFLREWTSTTKTKTKPITTRQTSKPCRAPSICADIARRGGSSRNTNESRTPQETHGGQDASRGWQHAKSAISNSRQHARTQTCGFAPQYADSSCGDRASNQRQIVYAKGAGGYSEHENTARRGSAPRLASERTLEICAQESSAGPSDHAQAAGQCSEPQIRAQKRAPVSADMLSSRRVRSVERLHGRAPVYNLEVDGTPEYFANGILVHNCKFGNPREVWDNLQFGMREVSADQPRVCITTTPRPLPILEEIEEKTTTVTVTGSSYENRANLAPSWFAETLAAYEGTRLGRQEIHGERLDDVEGRVYSSFSKLPFPLGNVDASIVDTGAEILIGQDFNVNPMATVIAVRVADECHVLDALEVRTSNTEEVAAEIRRRYPRRKVIVCPDPSGKARKTSAPVGQTDFTILERAGFEVRAPNAAPPVVDRVNNMQALLLQGVRRRLRIHPRAKPLIQALSNLTYKEGTSIIDKGMGLDHQADAIGYLCWSEFNVMIDPARWGSSSRPLVAR